MTRKVTVVDYGCGNLLSVSRGLEESGGTVKVTTDADKIANAERLANHSTRARSASDGASR